MKVSRWLFDSVQYDLNLLQSKYKEKGYNLTLEQCYEAGYLYSERYSGNWLHIGDVSQSISYVEKVINYNGYSDFNVERR